MLVRDYVEGDAEAIVRLYCETIHATNLADYSPEQVRAWAPTVPDAALWHTRQAGRCTLVVEQAGALLGFAELEADGHLDMLYCRQDAVHRGVGAKLYAALERRARARHLRRIFTESSRTARPFFERQGFRLIEPRAAWCQGEALANFAMEKSLDTP